MPMHFWAENNFRTNWPDSGPLCCSSPSFLLMNKLDFSQLNLFLHGDFSFTGRLTSITWTVAWNYNTCRENDTHYQLEPKRNQLRHHYSHYHFGFKLQIVLKLCIHAHLLCVIWRRHLLSFSIFILGISQT